MGSDNGLLKPSFKRNVTAKAYIDMKNEQLLESKIQIQ